MARTGVLPLSIAFSRASSLLSTVVRRAFSALSHKIVSCCSANSLKSGMSGLSTLCSVSDSSEVTSTVANLIVLLGLIRCRGGGERGGRPRRFLGGIP